MPVLGQPALRCTCYMTATAVTTHTPACLSLSPLSLLLLLLLLATSAACPTQCCPMQMAITTAAQLSA